MNIEVGEYVRDDEGFIMKINEVYYDDKYKDYAIKSPSKPFFIYSKNVYKHSKNIIDLIEAGDYVNGKYVYKNGEDFSGYKCLHMESSKVYACEDFIYEDDIKSIVTKEQFENMEYIL